ncbi:MAG: acetylglutamate kinase [Ferruginibacter sp.]
MLWNVIKKNDWQLNFRRQHPMTIYIADFYCHKIKLVIKLDGGYHENKNMRINDRIREKEISEFGIKVLRFKNEEIINSIEKVLRKITDTITLIQTTKKDNAVPDTPNTESAKEADWSKTSPPAGGAGGETGYSKTSSQVSGVEAGSIPAPPQLFVIKIGGNIIDDDSALQSFLKNFASIRAKKILVHGGGKIATKIGEQLGIPSNYINGRRITDAATIDLVTMVYGGLVNKKIVAKLQALQCNAIGLTGADANILPATKRPIVKSQIKDKDVGKEAEYSTNAPLGDGGIDYGFAGDIKKDAIGVQNLDLLLSNNFTLIIAPLTHDGKGQMLNTNADTIASALAVGLSKNYAVRLIYCFEKKGVLENVDNENSVIGLITKEKYRQLIEEKKLFDGILPKIDNAFAAIDNGVKEVLIGDANDLLQNITDNTCGTLIK